MGAPGFFVSPCSINRNEELVPECPARPRHGEIHGCRHGMLFYSARCLASSAGEIWIIKRVIYFVRFHLTTAWSGGGGRGGGKEQIVIECIDSKNWGPCLSPCSFPSGRPPSLGTALAASSAWPSQDCWGQGFIGRAGSNPGLNIKGFIYTTAAYSAALWCN